MARMVAKKNLEMEKEMAEEIEGYQKGDTYCKICNSEENTHYQLVKHYHKYHENKALFVCNKCGKGFFYSGRSSLPRRMPQRGQEDQMHG